MGGQPEAGEFGVLTCLTGVAVLALDEAPAAAGEDGIPNAHCRRRISWIPTQPRFYVLSLPPPPVEHRAVLGPGRRVLRGDSRRARADGCGGGDSRGSARVS